MRTIKFRAWHKRWNLMASDIELGSQEANIIVGNTSDILDINEEYSNLIFMQFTGLHDKNGKEIYEGDILKVPDLYETPENTYPTYHYEKVIYANHGFGTDNAMFYEDGDYISEECEVVGSIYENPELLEQTA